MGRLKLPGEKGSRDLNLAGEEWGGVTTAADDKFLIELDEEEDEVEGSPTSSSPSSMA